MKPFLLLQLRPLDKVSQNEYEDILKFGNLKPEEVHRVRMEQEGIPETINLDNYSGVIVGGGPSNVSDPEEKKKEHQKKFEKDFPKLIQEIVEKDIPYFGICYGLGILVQNVGGVIGKEKYTEPNVEAPMIKLNEEGLKDSLLEGLPKEFQGFMGHKEAVQTAPSEVVILGSTDRCPYHIVRIKKNIYAFQFHPEMGIEGIRIRVAAYKNEGYFPPEDGDKIVKAAEQENVWVPMEILKRFVEKYRKY